MYRFFLAFLFCFHCFSVELPTQTVPVDIGLYVHDVGNIDAQQQIVEIEATLTMAWSQESIPLNNTPAKDAFYDTALDAKLNEIWMPYLYVENGRGPREVIQKALFYDDNGRWMYQERFKVDVETELNVRLFPFDEQKIHVSVVPFGIPSTKIHFIKNPRWEGIFKATERAEWQVLGYKTVTLAVEEGPHSKEEIYRFHIDYKRNPGFYVYKMIIPMLMLVVLAMMSLLMKGDPISNRSQIALTCILSIIALQLVVYNSIPKVSYAIYIDVLFTISFLTACAILLRIALFNSILYLRKMRKFRTFIDVFLPLCFVGALIIATLTFFG